MNLLSWSQIQNFSFGNILLSSWKIVFIYRLLSFSCCVWLLFANLSLYKAANLPLDYDQYSWYKSTMQLILCICSNNLSAVNKIACLSHDGYFKQVLLYRSVRVSHHYTPIETWKVKWFCLLLQTKDMFSTENTWLWATVTQAIQHWETLYFALHNISLSINLLCCLSL